MFLAGLPEIDPVAVLVYRLFYLIIPLLLAIGVVLVFEKAQFRRR